jgi:hypothetical protein
VVDGEAVTGEPLLTSKFTKEVDALDPSDSLRLAALSLFACLIRLAASRVYLGAARSDIFFAEMALLVVVDFVSPAAADGLFF